MKLSISGIARASAGLALGLCIAAGPAFAQMPMSKPGQVSATENTIHNRLNEDPTLRDNDIKVTVDGKVATLKGKVDTESEMVTAVRLARVQGIEVVDNQLEVGSRGVTNAVSDSGVTTGVKAGFYADSTLRKEHISVDTNNGVVSLKGVVPSAAVREAAIEKASHASGVKSVDARELLVAPKP